MPQSPLSFDIETGAILDTDRILSLAKPFSPEKKHPGEFNPASVKYGQMKDPAKRAAKLAECEQKHAALVESYESDVEKARDEWSTKTLEDAALSPATGCVLVVGFMDAIDRTRWAALAGADEAETLGLFWRKYEECRKKNRQMVGHNIDQFDLPFLIRRSIILRVDIPRNVFVVRGKWINFDEIFVDTRPRWLLNQDASKCLSSLDHIGEVLGEGGKLIGPDGEPVHGKDFGRLWRSEVAADRDLAMAYLHRDLELTARVAVRLGVC